MMKRMRRGRGWDKKDIELELEQAVGCF